MRGAQRVRQRGDKRALAGGDALLHQRGKAAQQVDVHFLGGGVQGLANLDRGGGGVAFQQQANRRDRDALVDNRQAVFVADFVAVAHQLSGFLDDAVMHGFGQPVRIGVGAYVQVDTQGNGTDV